MIKLKLRSPSRGTTIDSLLSRSTSGNGGVDGLGGRSASTSSRGCLTRRSSSSSSSTQSMIMLPQADTLDMEVFQTLPSELQRELAQLYLQQDHHRHLPEESRRTFQKVLQQEEEQSWRAADSEEQQNLLAFLEAGMEDELNEKAMMTIRHYIQQYELTSELKIVLREMVEARCQFDLHGMTKLVKWMISCAVNQSEWTKFLHDLQKVIHRRLVSL